MWVNTVQHVHFGAGKFGLGFGAYISRCLGWRLTILNRTRPTQTNQPNKNELLACSNRFCLQYPDGEIEEVDYAQFIEYGNESLLPSSCFTDSDLPLFISTSIGNKEGYNLVATVTARSLLKHSKLCVSIPRIFLCSLENEISSEFFREKLLDSLQEIRSSLDYQYWAQKLVATEAVVDRACTRIILPDNLDDPLTVECERFFSLFLDNEAFDGDEYCDISVYYSEYLEIEKLKKRIMVNGAHILLAAHCMSLGTIQVSNYFSTRYDNPEDRYQTRDQRVRFFRAILKELSECFKSAVKIMDPADNRGYTQYLQSRYGSAEEERYINILIDRFSTAPDQPYRILSRLIGRDGGMTNEAGDYFVDRLVPRLLGPIGAYCEIYGHEPTRIMEIMIGLFKIIGKDFYTIGFNDS